MREDPLFCASSPNFDDRLKPKTPMKKRTLTEMVKRAARKAGIEQWRDVYPHCLRKAYESALRDNRLDTKDQEFLLGHILPGSQDAYYDRSKIETLRKRYTHAVFFPERALTDEALRRKQLIDTAKMLEYSEEKLAKLQEILQRARTVDEAVEEFRKLGTDRVKVPAEDHLRKLAESENNNGEHKVVQGEEKMLSLLDRGWTLVRELNGGNRFLMRRNSS